MRLCLALLVSLAITLPLLASDALPDEFVAAHANRLNRLFEQLDPQNPEIGPLIDQWKSGQHIDAAKSLASYYRTKAFPPRILEPITHGPNLMKDADQALQNRFSLHGSVIQLPELGASGFDWTLESLDVDKELAWMLNRHTFLPQLAEAGRSTGDPVYQEKMNALLGDWILQNPASKGISFSPQWRALEVARRILNAWTHVFYDRESMDPSTALLVLSSIPDHGLILSEHASFWGGNHLVTEQLALLTLATAWPEFKDAATWREKSTASLSEQLVKQTYPDGSHKELSNHYQKVILRSAHQFLQILALTDPNFKERPVAERIEKQWEFFAYSTRPDGFGPLNNASDLEHNATLLKEVWRFYDRPDWLAIANAVSKESPDAGSPSRLFPWAGQVYLRNHLRQDADWIYFDAGPYGTAHQHVDRLHISACFNGRPVLVDSGRYTYQPGPWRDYFKGPLSHSVLLLNGKAAEQGAREVQAPMPVVFDERENVIFISASSSFQTKADKRSLPTLESPVPWTRAILYDKRGFAIVLDHVVSFRHHAFNLIWNLHPDISSREVPDVIHVLASPANSSTEITEGTEHPEAGGWYSPEYGIKQANRQLKLSGRIDSPTTIITLIAGGGISNFEIEQLSKPGAPLQSFRLTRSGKAVAEVELRLHPKPELIRYEKILLTEGDR